MLNMNMSQMIPTIVESLLKRNSPEDKGLLISLYLRDDDYGYDDTGNNKVREERSAATIVRLLFRRSSNYTEVGIQYKFGKWLRDGFLTDPYRETTRFKFVSNHDSCWRDGCTRWTSDHWQSVEDYFGFHPRDRQLSRFYNFNGFDPNEGINLVKLDQFDDVRCRREGQSDYDLSLYTVGWDVKLSSYNKG